MAHQFPSVLINDYLIFHSEFTNGSSRCRLQEQVRRLALLYDKPYLIVEADRTASRDPRFKGDSCPALDPSSVIFKPNTPYFLQTLAALAQTDLSVLYSESQGKLLRFFFFNFQKRGK